MTIVFGNWILPTRGYVNLADTLFIQLVHGCR